MSSNPRWARGQYNCPHPTNNHTCIIFIHIPFVLNHILRTESLPNACQSTFSHVPLGSQTHQRPLWYLAHKFFVNVLSSERQLAAWFVLHWLDNDVDFMLLEVGRIRGLKSTTCTPDTNASITAKRTEKKHTVRLVVANTCLVVRGRHNTHKLVTHQNLLNWPPMRSNIVCIFSRFGCLSLLVACSAWSTNTNTFSNAGVD